MSSLLAARRSGSPSGGVDGDGIRSHRTGQSLCLEGGLIEAVVDVDVE